MYEDLILKAKKLRQDTFNTFVEQGEAHIGGAFSMIEMVILLYEKVLKKEDKFILSKAHASIPLCLLLQEKYPMVLQELKKVYKKKLVWAILNLVGIGVTQKTLFMLCG